MIVGVEIDGVRETRARLGALTRKMQRGALRNTWRKGGRVIEKKARTLAPEDEGDLKRGIGTSVKATNTELRADIGVRLRRPGAPARYYGFVELGTSRLPPRPFLRPALKSAGGEAVRKIAGELRSDINRIAAKHGL